MPNVFIQYWAMRVMAYLGHARRPDRPVGRMAAPHARIARSTSHVFLRLAAWAVVLPFLMNTAGWVLTENGRQPWIVQGLMQTSDGVSPSVSTTTMWISLLMFTLLYGVLDVVAWVLMARHARKAIAPAPGLDERGAPQTAMTY